MSCDIVDTHMVDNSSNDQTKVVQANQQLGMIGSSLEHLVLEQLFATDTGAEGFSAVKAIQLANQQGQKIFTVTKDNYQTIIPQLQLAPAAIADIQAAAQNGLTVTTHQNRISVNGYTGEGYIILNDRGVGAWMINGGLYGGILILKQLSYLLWLNFRAFAALSDHTTGTANTLLGGIARHFVFIQFMLKVEQLLLDCPQEEQAALIIKLTITTALSLLGILAISGIFGPMVIFAATFFGGLITDIILTNQREEACK